MEVFMKVGTHPAGLVRVYRKRKPPALHTHVMVKASKNNGDYRIQQWTRVFIHEIKNDVYGDDVPLYFASL